MPFTDSGAGDCLSGPGLVAATRWLALFTGDPSGAGVEVAAAGYARLERSPAQMPVVANAVSIAMGEWDDSADESWGTPDYVGLMDAAAAGNLKAYSQIDPPITEITAASRVFSELGDVTIRIPLA